MAKIYGVLFSVLGVAVMTGGSEYILSGHALIIIGSVWLAADWVSAK